jgi:hypothetical protein
MKLCELLIEHTGWNLDKGLEFDFAKVIEAVAAEQNIPPLSEKGETNKKHLINTAKQLLNGASEVIIHGKPSGAKPAYGSGSEPKSDLNVTIGHKSYAISVKSGPAYAMSAGSKDEYLGIASAAIALYEELYPAEAQKHRTAIIKLLMPIANIIGANHKKTDYTVKGLKDKKDSWFHRGFDKANLKQHERNEFQYIKNDAAAIIDYDNSALKGEYKQMLSEMESIAKSGLKEAFSTKEFAQSFMWEITSGVSKFNGLHEIANFNNARAAYANTVIYLDGHGIFDVSTPNTPFIVDATNNYAVRLQNVPRGWCGTYFKNVRAGGEPGAKLLADSLREIEFSLKIGIGPHANKTIRESMLLEFSNEYDLLLLLPKIVSKTTLLGFCNAYGIVPMLKR